ncbi:MAG: HlyD family efflux transporter periplasmic adaptor subunit [Planctomycetaceae bacterium]|nr:HlyD family efflux transporter periplasmic adaptor subunit [Planctomycetaceae bacterium]
MPKNLVTEKAVRQNFLISLSVQGFIDSQNNVTLESKVEGSTTIISIVPEGTWVEEGEIVCELDGSSIEDQLDSQMIQTSQALAARDQALEALKIQENQNDSDIAAAKLNIKLAELDLKKFKEGEKAQKQKELEGKVALAKTGLLSAQENLDFTRDQVKKGYKTQNELESARIAVKQKEFELQSAEEELKVYEKFTIERTLTELEAQLDEFRNELIRVEAKAEAALIQYKADVDAREKTLDLERKKEGKLQSNFEACKMRAPQAGEVVYANMQNSRRSSNEGSTIEEGAQVRERQAIINLPDVTKMKVDCRIHESLIRSIKKGLRARIRTDAYPDKIFNGVVYSVSTVPMSGQWPNTDLREYETVIHLTDAVEEVRKLRPGLTAQVEILVANRPDILQVPVQAIVNVARKHVAYVVKGGKSERRFVETGESNQTHIEVKDGIEEGEYVVLNPRSQFDDEISALEAELSAEDGADPDLENLPKGEDAPAPKPGASEGGRPAGGGDPAAFFNNLDKDGDGKISEDEAPGRMKENFSKLDKDGDGFITKEEMSAARPPGGGPGGGGAPGGGAPGGGAEE